MSYSVSSDSKEDVDYNEYVVPSVQAHANKDVTTGEDEEEEGYLGLAFEEEGAKNVDSNHDDDGYMYMAPYFSDHKKRDDFYMPLDLLAVVSQSEDTRGNVGTEYEMPPDHESVM